MFDPKAIAEITTLAEQLAIRPEALMAIAFVESGGQAFGWERRPLIRWEGHYFHRYLSRLSDQGKLREALMHGLAALKAGAIKNPRSQKMRWALLDRARDIDSDAADQSVSWGVGQVMGAHWRALSYPTVGAMVARVMEGIAGQVEVMGRFIAVNGLIESLRHEDWELFARRYNGPLALKAGYHMKIKTAYRRYRAALGNGHTSR